MSRGFAPRSSPKPFPPKRGDIWQVHLQLLPERRPSGRPRKEPPGSHPAIVVSENALNARGLAIVAFMASEDRDLEGTVFLASARGAGVDGYISPYHLHALDWEAAFVARVGTCPAEEFNEVVKRISYLIGFPRTDE